MKYTYLIDIYPDCPMSEDKEFDNDEQALAYGQDLFNHSNAPFTTVINQDGKKIKEFD